MKKYFITSLFVLVGISTFLVLYNARNSSSNTVAYDAYISIYVDDVATSVDRLDTFLKQNYSFIETVDPQNEYTLVHFTIPYPSTDGLTYFLSEESTNGIIYGQKTLVGGFEFEPTATQLVNVEAKIIDVATLNS